MTDRLDQQTLFGLPWLNAGTAATPFDQTVPVIDSKSPFATVFVGMTIDAILQQERPDLLFKELDLRWVAGRGWWGSVRR